MYMWLVGVVDNDNHYHSAAGVGPKEKEQHSAAPNLVG
jgi:hypothetical protein